jgi:hypothetical protein
VTGAIGGVTRPPDGCFTEISGVTTESALVNFSFLCPTKRQATVFKIVHGLNSVFGKN